MTEFKGKKLVKSEPYHRYYSTEYVTWLEEQVASQAAALKQYRDRDEAERRRASRQARHDADHIGYHEDEYDR